MADRCKGRKCRRVIRSDENAHQWHGLDCDRALTGVCQCDGWLCSRCCSVSGECSPLQLACSAAREETRRRAEA